MKIVYILLGVPGSGKSYLANNLAREAYLDNNLSSVIVSADYYFTLLENWSDDATNGRYVYGWNPKWLGDAHLFCFRQFESALTAEIGCIIVDNTNLRYDNIAKYAEKAVTEGYEVQIIEPNTDWKYDARECHKRCQHNVPLEKIKQTLASLSKLKLLHNDMLKNPTEYFKQLLVKEVKYCNNSVSVSMSTACDITRAMEIINKVE